MCDMLSARADQTQTDLTCEGAPVKSAQLSTALLEGVAVARSSCVQGTGLGCGDGADDPECRMLLESMTVTCKTHAPAAERAASPTACDAGGRGAGEKPDSDLSERGELRTQQSRLSLTRRETARVGGGPSTANAVMCQPLRLGCHMAANVDGGGGSSRQLATTRMQYSHYCCRRSRDEGGRRGRPRSDQQHRIATHYYCLSEASSSSVSAASLTRRQDAPASPPCTAEEDEEERGGRGGSPTIAPAASGQRPVRLRKVPAGHLRALSRSELRDWTLSRRSRSLTRARRGRRRPSLRSSLAALPVASAEPPPLPLSSTSADYASISCMDKDQVARLHIRPLSERRPTLVSLPSSAATSRWPSHGVVEDDGRALSQAKRGVPKAEPVVATAKTTSPMRFVSALAPSHDDAEAEKRREEHTRRVVKRWSSEAPQVVSMAHCAGDCMAQGAQEALPLVMVSGAEPSRPTPRGPPESIMCRPSIACHNYGSPHSCGALTASESGRVCGAGSPFSVLARMGAEVAEKGGASRHASPRRRWKNALQHSSALPHETRGGGTTPPANTASGVDEADMNGICFRPDEDEAERLYGSGSRKGRAMTVVVEGEVEGADHSHASHVTARMGDSTSMESSCFGVFPRPFVPLHRRQWSVTSSFHNNMSCTRTRLLSEKFADNEFDQLTASEVLWTDM